MKKSLDLCEGSVNGTGGKTFFFRFFFRKVNSNKNRFSLGHTTYPEREHSICDGKGELRHIQQVRVYAGECVCGCVRECMAPD